MVNISDIIGICKEMFFMIKVTLLGDSIRLVGYGTKVPELLGDEFEVYQPAENCRFAKYTLRGMWDWKEAMEGTRIVHWNNGLWDCCNLFGDGCFSSEDEYVSNMLRVAKILLSRYDKVIFATTTVVRGENALNKNKIIDRYNKILVPKLEELGIIINDLYTTVVSDIDKFIRSDDNIHLTDEGIDICARQVAEIIKKTALELSEESEKSGNKSVAHTAVPV